MSNEQVDKFGDNFGISAERVKARIAELKYDGCYVRLANSPALWAVDVGHKRPVESPAHMYEIGLRAQHIVTEDELDAIPFLVLEADEEE